MPAQPVLPHGRCGAKDWLRVPWVEPGRLESGLQCGPHTERPCARGLSCPIPACGGAPDFLQLSCLLPAWHKGGRGRALAVFWVVEALPSQRHDC